MCGCVYPCIYDYLCLCMYVYIFIIIYLCLDRSTLLQFETSVLDRSPVRRWKAEPRLSKWNQAWRLRQFAVSKPFERHRHRSVSRFGPSLGEICNTLAAGLLLYSSNTSIVKHSWEKAMCCCSYCCCCLLLHKSSRLLHPWANKVTTLQYAHSSPSKQYRFLACTDTWQRYVKVRTESEHGEMEEEIDSSRMFTVFSCCCCSCWLFDVAWL